MSGNFKSFITETEVRLAASNSYSNAAAAIYLRINKQTWKKYASLFFEPTTGLTYFQYLQQRKKPKIKPPRKTGYSPTSIPLQDILEGLHPTYDKVRLQSRLIKEGWFVEQCANCGFSERHLLTYNVPLILECLDGNERNFKRENLRMICYNCCALTTNYKIKIAPPK